MKNIPRLSYLILSLFFLLNVQINYAQSIKKNLKKSELSKWSNCGILLYDIKKKDTIFEYRSDKYFVPASTTKILTFYSALQYLPDSLTAYKYAIQKDTIYIWGVGNPSLANPIFKNWDDKSLDFLKNTDKKIVLCYNRYLGAGYGKGWMWDDYTDSFQPEINEFPLYGNLVNIKYQNHQIESFPVDKEIIKCVQGNDLKRLNHENTFEYPQNEDLDTLMTYIVNAQTSRNALKNILHKNIEIDLHKLMPANAKKMQSSIHRDTVLKVMMQESDNFIAEQLHLMMCDQLNFPLESSRSIVYQKENAFTFFPKDFKWVDGSGLSRYNLLTPELLVATFNTLYQEKGLENLKPLLSAGGQNGTLKTLFTIDNTPYVFAKTGTFTGVACISGFLICKSKKILSFALMSNNHMEKSSTVLSEFEKLIDKIYLNY